MNTINLIIIVVLALFITILITYYVIKAIKNKWVGEILDVIKTSMKDAETKYESGQGEQKKEYVLEQVQNKCSELNIPFEFIKKLVSLLINQIIEHYNIMTK